MREFRLKSDGALSMGKHPSVLAQDAGEAASAPWWRSLLRRLRDSFNVPFVSDWEDKTGLQWKDWGKL